MRQFENEQQTSRKSHNITGSGKDSNIEEYEKQIIQH